MTRGCQWLIKTFDISRPKCAVFDKFIQLQIQVTVGFAKKRSPRKSHSISILIRVAFNNATTFPWCWRRFLRAAHKVKSATRNGADTCFWKQRFCCYSRAPFQSWWCRRSHLDYGWTAALSAQSVGHGPLVLKWCCFIAVESLQAFVTAQLANVDFRTVCVKQTWNTRLANRVKRMWHDIKYWEVLSFTLTSHSFLRLSFPAGTL